MKLHCLWEDVQTQTTNEDWDSGNLLAAQSLDTVIDW
jgi:hypothetical protein